MLSEKPCEFHFPAVKVMGKATFNVCSCSFSPLCPCSVQRCNYLKYQEARNDRAVKAGQ